MVASLTNSFAAASRLPAPPLIAVQARHASICPTAQSDRPAAPKYTRRALLFFGLTGQTLAEALGEGSEHAVNHGRESKDSRAPARLATPIAANRLPAGPLSALVDGNRGSPELLLFLQGAAGNAAVSHLLTAQRQAVAAPPAPPAAAPAAAPAAPAHPTIRRGSRGRAVEELQLKLNVIPAAAGAQPLIVDGIFGGTTHTAVQDFQKRHMPGTIANGVVGPLTWTGILLAAVAAETAAQPAHPILHLGDQRAEVGQAQEKLNATGAAPPPLPIDAVFSATMQTAVRQFQTTTMHMVPPTGIIDANTWAALDLAAPGGGTRPGRGAPIEQHVKAGGGATPLGTAIGTVHPVVGAGQVEHGPAVKELQQKLNAWLRSQRIKPLLREDGDWGTKTHAALVQFQGAGATGQADAATWTRLDAFPSTVGFEQRTWQETVGNEVYGPGGGASKYSWELRGNTIVVHARIHFVGAPPNANWFGYIKNTWNRFKAVNPANPAQSVLIDFEPVQGSGTDAQTITVHAGSARANAANWYLADPDAANTVSHEFGHLIGLRDEYQQTSADYRTVTGYEPGVGDATGPGGGATPNTVATNLRNALAARNNAAAYNATFGLGMKQGAFAQQVAAAYKALASVNLPAVPPPAGAAPDPARAATGNLVPDLDTGLTNTADPANPAGAGSIPINKYEVIEIFSYSSGSIMGDPSRHADPHDHGAQPRHVQEFVDIVRAHRGGNWVAAFR